MPERELIYWVKFIALHEPQKFRAPNYHELFKDIFKFMERYGFMEWMIQA